MEATVAMQPEQIPAITVIWGMTPDAAATAFMMLPYPLRAATPSSTFAPAEPRIPTTGAPVFIAASMRETIFFACASLMAPFILPSSCA